VLLSGEGSSGTLKTYSIRGALLYCVVLSECGKSSSYFVVEIGVLVSPVGQTGSVDIRPLIAVQSWDDRAEFLHRLQMEV
jgi:hypothetical protein